MLLILFFALFSASKASPWDNLTATIVLVEFESETNQSLTDNQILEQNLLKYQQVLVDVQQNVSSFDLIIFPEDSLKVVPETSVEITIGDNPCSSGNYPTFMVVLSCNAKLYKSYLVTNIVEKVPCDNATSKSENCKNFGYFYYNTDVVFDRDGTIIESYHKYNLFGEFAMDRPDVPEVVTFETDLGLKFGIFTCFDILFKSPAQDAARDVDAIIYPTYWHSELPFLTATQAQQQFAYVHNVVLFAAGASSPLEASGGSGIYRGAQDTLSSTIVAEGGTRALIFRSVNGEVSTPEEKSDDELALEMDAFPLMADDSLPLYETRLLDVTSQTISEQICSTNETTLCCNFSIKLTTQPLSGNFYSYMMIAYSGFRHYPNIADGLLEVCGLVACLNSSISSCGLRFPNYREVDWPISFDEIVIEANFEISENKTQFPNSLKSSIRPIDASETEWTSEKVVFESKPMLKKRFATKKSQDRLMTFAIYGRDFGKDKFPEDDNQYLNKEAKKQFRQL